MVSRLLGGGYKQTGYEYGDIGGYGGQQVDMSGLNALMQRPNDGSLDLMGWVRGSQIGKALNENDRRMHINELRRMDWERQRRDTLGAQQYTATLNTHYQRATDEGRDPVQYLIDQNRTMLTDPNFANKSELEKQMIMKAHRTMMFNQLHNLYKTGKSQEAVKLAKYLGVPVNEMAIMARGGDIKGTLAKAAELGYTEIEGDPAHMMSPAGFKVRKQDLIEQAARNAQGVNLGFFLPSEITEDATATGTPSTTSTTTTDQGNKDANKEQEQTQTKPQTAATGLNTTDPIVNAEPNALMLYENDSSSTPAPQPYGMSSIGKAQELMQQRKANATAVAELSEAYTKIEALLGRPDISKENAIGLDLLYKRDQIMKALAEKRKETEVIRGLIEDFNRTQSYNQVGTSFDINKDISSIDALLKRYVK